MTDQLRWLQLALQHWYVLPILTLLATAVVIEWLRDY
jgi:hypothetical protein